MSIAGDSRRLLCSQPLDANRRCKEKLWGQEWGRWIGLGRDEEWSTGSDPYSSLGANFPDSPGPHLGSQHEQPS